MVGAQTLYKGLQIIEAVAKGQNSLKKICLTLNLTKSTAHRLVTVLIQEGYIRINGTEYILGARLIEYGARSLNSYPLRSAALAHLKELSAQTKDTVHLGIREHNEVIYIEKLASTRHLEMNSRVGFRMPLVKTGIGKALLLDANNDEISKIYIDTYGSHKGLSAFLEKMENYKKMNCTFDLEENEMSIRCVAAAIRDAGNNVIAAISVASISCYMDDKRMKELAPLVKLYANKISSEFGRYEP